MPRANGTPEPNREPASEIAYLRSPRAIRDRAEALFARASGGALEHFALHEELLPEVIARVTEVTRRVYPDVRRIPYHARFRHFSAGGVDRIAALDGMLRGATPDERLATKIELAVTSVLLDAGAGERWSYRGTDGRVYARSEGLAVASYDLFVSGAFSGDREPAPLRADARGLASIGEDELARGFQSRAENPLVGLAGRAAILRKLGESVLAKPRYFGGGAPRLGGLGAHLVSLARDGELRASTVLEVVLDALSDIWPGREQIGGTNLGDVWTHPAVGRVPFHKLSQWLTYSLCEPLEERGVKVTGMNELTGLAEYRNGGLFVDAGVLVPKHAAVTEATHAVSSTVVVEWRALTIALLDRVAEGVRARLGLTAEELPLAKVLEGGTWRAGRELARERRADGSPPIRVESDGTVF